MMKRTILFCWLMLIGAFHLQSQDIGAFKSMAMVDGKDYYFTTTKGQVIIEFCTPSMFRVRASWTGKFEADEPWMVKRYDWTAVKSKTSDKAESFSISTSALTIRIQKKKFSISVFDSTGKLISRDL